MTHNITLSDLVTAAREEDDFAADTRALEDPRLAKPLIRRKPQKPRTKPNSKEETLLQKRVVTMLRRVLIKEDTRVFAIPNGGRRDLSVAVEQKATGTMAGVFDLQLLWLEPVNPGAVLSHVGWIEMKIWPNDLSTAQKEFAAFVDRLGHRRTTCWTECDVLLAIRAWRMPHDEAAWKKWHTHYFQTHEVLSSKGAS